MKASVNIRKIQNRKIADISFKGLLQFKYLGETVNNEGGNSSATNERIQNANSGYTSSI